MFTSPPHKSTTGIMDPATPNYAATSTPKKMQLSPSVERLYKVKESINQLNTNIKENVEQKKDVEEARMLELKEIAQKVEKNLTLEMRKRAESDKVLQTMFDNKLATIQESLEKKLAEKFSALQITIDIQSKRINTLEKLLADEKERNDKITQEIKIGVVGQLDDLKNLIEQEKVARLEKEAQILKRMTDDFNKMTDRLDSERILRDQALANLRDEIQRKDLDKMKNEQTFKQQVMEEIEVMKQNLKQEMLSREATEEHMVQTIDQIVQQIQESLHIVAKH